MIETTNLIPVIFGVMVFLASLISLKLGISVAIVEILLGAIGGQFGLQAQEWMTYLAGFGGILLTFLAGTEIDTDLMKQKFKASFLIGFFFFPVAFSRSCCIYIFRCSLEFTGRLNRRDGTFDNLSGCGVFRSG